MPTKTQKEVPMFQPRLIRLKQAPLYVGMDKNRFRRDVRPNIPELKIGKKGVAFDRHDLDAWVDSFKQAQLEANGHSTSRKTIRNSEKGLTGRQKAERAAFDKALKELDS